MPTDSVSVGNDLRHCTGLVESRVYDCETTTTFISSRQ